MTNIPAISLRRLSKSFGDLDVLGEMDLDVGRGEFVSILGPSGCGKSTLLSILSGIAEATTGEITIHGTPLNESGQPFAWMPQSDALLPWRTVVDNVGLGYQVAGGLSKRKAREQARLLFPAFGLEEFSRALPYQLSGGMRQRVALARTIAQGRDMLLLDEPFGALDAITRTELQLWLEQIWGVERPTVILITHDVREAVLLSDRIYVFSDRPGQIVAEFEVPLDRPRTIEMLAGLQATQLELDLLRALHVGSGDTP
jgi:ABC-type nitrate/sulfonate/bicarbonate transport system ATPase subunit